MSTTVAGRSLPGSRAGWWTAEELNVVLIIPTQVFLGFCKFSGTVSPHSCILPGTAGLWPMATAAVTLPQGLFPQTLIIQIAHLMSSEEASPGTWPQSTALGRGKTYGTLNSREIGFIVCRPLNHQASLPPQGRKGHYHPISCQQDTSPGLSQLEAPYSQHWALELRQKCWSAIQRLGNYGKENGKR